MRRTWTDSYSAIVTARQTVSRFRAKGRDKAAQILAVSLILAFSVALAIGRTMRLSESVQPWNTVATFSILGFDADTKEIGIAVQSRVFSVGNGVLWAEAGVGAVATQAFVDISYGPQ